MKDRFLFKISIRLLLIALFLAALPPNIVRADDTGRLAVMLEEEFRKEIPDEPVVALSLYQIGILDTEGGGDWKMNAGFTDYGVLEAETTSDMVKIAEQLAEDIPDKDVEPQDITLTGGRAVLDELPFGIYLGVLKDAPEGVDVDPFVITMPAMDKAEADQYDYTVTLKAVYEPPEEETEEETTEEETAVPETKPKPKETKPDKKQVKTGDDSRMMLWVVLLMTSFMGVMALLIYRSGGISAEAEYADDDRKTEKNNLKTEQPDGAAKKAGSINGGKGWKA